MKMCFFVLLLLGNYFADAADFQVGISIRSLNSPEGVSLAGYGGGPRRNWLGRNKNKYAHWMTPSEGVHDDPQVKVVVMDFKGEIFVVLSTDLIAASKILREQLAKNLKDFVVDESHIILTATHTHSGPSGFAHSTIWEILAADKFVPAILERFTKSATRAVREAFDSRVPALISIAQTKLEDVIHNRRDNPAQIDPEATLIRFDSLAGEPLGTIINFPIHGTILDNSNFKLSGDAPSCIEDSFARLTRSSAIFVNGAEGDVSPISESSTFKSCRKLGDKIAQGLFESWSTMIGSTPKRMAIREFHQPIGKAKLNVFPCIHQDKKSGKLLLPLPSDLPTEAVIEAFLIDSTVFATIPGEPIVKLGWKFKDLIKRAGYQNAAVIGLANDHLGYATDRKEYFKGGYEACSDLYGAELGTNLIRGVKKALSLLPQP